MSALIDILTDLAEFYSHQFDEKELKVYINIFKNYTKSDLKFAIDKHHHDIKKGMFFPFPADLLNYMSSKATQYRQDFPKIECERKCSSQTAEKYLKEIKEILNKKSPKT